MTQNEIDNMTLEQAKEVIRTYQMPLNDMELKTFKKAVAICSSSFTIVPNGGQHGNESGND